MRNTYLQSGAAKYGRAVAPAANVTQGASIQPPVGGWDAFNPLAAMPPQNAVQLINFFPQPGYVELRRGHINWCDTGSGVPVESLMGYMGQDTTKDILIAATGAKLYDVTTEATPVEIGTGGYASDRWQFTNFAGTGGSFTFMVNGIDDPQYYDGSAIVVPVITRSDSGDPADFININVYRSRIWFVAKNSTKAFYLPTDSIAGVATEFDVGNQFINGGYLQAIGTWSTDANDGPNEYIAFISSQGDVAIYNILDPTDPNAISFRGRSEISQPVGWRCITKIGSDLGIITLDGVLPLSQVLTYDKAALIGASITRNIRQAITDAVRQAKDHFGWQLHSYPRNTMAILNVPLTENDGQEQYVMNTITGSWARFTGQYANCWEVFLDRPYFGDNMGVVHLADQAGGDENQTLSADMQCAWNYYDERGRQKDWKMIRPNITIDQTFPVLPQMGINVDFGSGATLSPINFNANATPPPLWDVSLWDEATWTGDITSLSWATVNGYGYCASIEVTVDIPWTPDLIDDTNRNLRFNGFDVLYAKGGFI